MSDKITQDIHSSAPGEIIDLFELDMTGLPGASDEPILRWHSGQGEHGHGVVWQGNLYSSFPVEADGFEMSSSGRIPRPTLTVANITGLLTSSIKEYDDLLGSKVTRKRTFSKYLDSYCYRGGAGIAGTCTNPIDAYSKKDCTEGHWTPYTEESCTEEIGVYHCFRSAYTASSIYQENVYGVDYWKFFLALGVAGASEYDMTVTFSGFTEQASSINGTKELTWLAPSAWGIKVSDLPDVPTVYEVGVSDDTLSTSSNILPAIVSETIWVAADSATCITLGASWLPPTPVGVWYGNSTEDDMAYFPEEVWYIDRKAVETNTHIQFELTAAHDIIGVKLPSRTIVSNLCPWVYKDPSTCGYGGDTLNLAGGAYASTTIDSNGSTNILSLFGGAGYGHAPTVRVKTVKIPAEGVIRFRTNNIYKESWMNERHYWNSTQRYTKPTFTVASHSPDYVTPPLVYCPGLAGVSGFRQGDDASGGTITANIKYDGTIEVVVDSSFKLHKNTLKSMGATIHTDSRTVDHGWYGPETYWYKYFDLSMPIYFEPQGTDVAEYTVDGTTGINAVGEVIELTTINAGANYTQAPIIEFTGGGFLTVPGAWDIDGKRVFDVSEDVCGKSFEDCEKRFPSSEPSPFGGFPGAGRSLG